MPNWCYNQVTFSHKDKALIERLEKASDTGLWFTAMLTENEIKKLTKNNVWVEL